MLRLIFPHEAIIGDVEMLADRVNELRPVAAPVVAGEPERDTECVGYRWPAVNGWEIGVFHNEDHHVVFSWDAPGGGTFSATDKGEYVDRVFTFFPEGHEARVDAWPADPARPLERLTM